MDLWQFSCYIEGYVAKCRQQEMNDLMLAMRVARYNNATKRTASDAKREMEEIKNSIEEILTDKETEKQLQETAEEEIEKLKKQLKYFK